MTPEEAIKILGLPEKATAKEREEIFRSQRTKLEQKLAQAPTLGLQNKYREVLRRLEEAYETLELLNDESDLPALKPHFQSTDARNIDTLKSSLSIQSAPAKLLHPTGASPSKSSPLASVLPNIEPVKESHAAEEASSNQKPADGRAISTASKVEARKESHVASGKIKWIIISVVILVFGVDSVFWDG